MATEAVNDAAVPSTSSEEWEDISVDGDGKLLKKILEAAPEDAEYPPDGAKVKCHYTGTLTDGGDKFDSSRDRNQPFEFTIGKGQVIKGWDVGMAKVKKGERAILRCEHTYGYGERGSPPKIPGGASLDFDVEILGWEEPGWEQSYLRIPGKAGKTIDGITHKELNEVEDGKWDKPDFPAEVTVSYSAYKPSVFGKAKTPKDLEGKEAVAEAKELTFIVGDNDPKEVPAIIDVLVTDVAKGQVKAFNVPGANLAYIGKQDEELIYVVELLKWEKGDNQFDIKIDARFEKAKAYKATGTERFKQGKLDTAIKYYTKSNDFLHDYQLKEAPEEKQNEAKALRAGTFNNIALMNLKLKNYEEVLKAIEDCVKENGANAKALTRKGQVFLEQGFPKRALEVYQEAAKLGEDAGNAGKIANLINSQIKRCEAAIAREQKKTDQMYKRMMRGMARQAKKEVKKDESGEKATEAPKDDEKTEEKPMEVDAES